ncbi:hypothetical protein L195_g062606, partial [Trifolium pratense]
MASPAGGVSENLAGPSSVKFWSDDEDVEP